MDVLRFITTGSVDDGKSTLIGRLLHDSRAILTDQLEALERQRRNGQESIDLALLTDGLRAEREQGITIDVAYKYFSTPRRKFIIADAPGHIEYTPNMVTGASNSDAAVILVDARHGVVEQTRRHSIVVSLLGIRHVIVAINKLDLVGFSEEIFRKIVREYAPVAEELSLKDVIYVPISARDGDNVVELSKRTPWYDGRSLLEILEQVDVTSGVVEGAPRFPVQYVIRPQRDSHHDYRGYAGRITSGRYRVGDEVVVLPGTLRSRISRIDIAGESVEEAVAPQSVVIHLDDAVDAGRGDLIARPDSQPEVTRGFDASICWFADHPLAPGDRYLLRINGRTVPAIVQNVAHRIDVNTLRKSPYTPDAERRNDILHVTIRTASAVAVDPYTLLRSGGGGILIDETSNATVAAVLVQ